MAGVKAGLMLPSAVAAAVAADASLTQVAGPASLLNPVLTGTQATFTLTISGGTGTVGLSSLGGIAAGMTATWATSDAATTAALTTQLNALATVNGFFTFTNPTTTTIVATCKYGGPLGNAVTGTGTGTGVTPSSATAFTGGGTATVANNFPSSYFTGDIGDINRLLQAIGNRFSWSS